jgi:hypothetical protein
MKQFITISILLICIGCTASSPSEEVAISETEHKITNRSVEGKCIDEALNRGYLVANCAKTFIKTCVTTQSKVEMDRAFERDLSLEFLKASSCSSEKTIYDEIFEEKYVHREELAKAIL